MKLFVLLLIVESLSSVGLDSLNIFDEFTSTQAKIYFDEQSACYDAYIHILTNSNEGCNPKCILYSVDTDLKLVEEIDIPPLEADTAYFNSGVLNSSEFWKNW